MEKVRYIVISLLLLLASSVDAQTWMTGMTFDYGFNRQKWDSTQQYNVVLDFPSLSYDETFEIRLSDANSLSMYGGFKNHFVLNKNVIVADFSLGLNLYNYTFDITKAPGAGPLDTTLFGVGKTDEIVWQDYLAQSEETNVKGIYPSIRLNLGYQRELLKYKSMVIYADAGVFLQRRFSFFQDFNKIIYEENDTIVAHFGVALNHKVIIPSVYTGLTLRIGSNTFGLRLGTNAGPVTRKIARLKMNESFVQVTYSKLFRSTHLGKEQVIYDEYQHLAQTRASEYRQGDKFSYLQFNISHDKRTSYENDEPTSSWLIGDSDSVQVTTEGYHLQPNVSFDLMLNTFFTHRWMMGLGLSMYEETYYSYGHLTHGENEIPFGDEVLKSTPDNPYQEYWTKTKALVGINSAVYISKRTLKVDPYVKGSAHMVLNYDVPVFLKANSDWRLLSFFPVYKLGAGADIRLRIKSSKFFVLGLGVDYNINPHTNYLQYYAKVGYYRKKKLKNQRY